MINKIRYPHLSKGKKYNCFPKDGSSRSKTEFLSGASITNGLINQKEKLVPDPTIRGIGRNKLPLLAIDGGGTKTIAVITDSRGKVLSSATSGSSNYQVSGKKETIKALKNVIKKTISLLNETVFPHDKEITFNVGVFALAGIDTKKDEVNVQEIVKQVIEEIGIHIDRLIVENDGLSVLLGKTNRTPGVILISGTGSIAFAHDGKGHYVRSGGWGHRIGDEGGGYWIGKEAIRSIMKMLDGRESETILSHLVLNHFQFKDYEQLYNWVYGPDYSIHEVAKVSTIVGEASQLGDPASKCILNRAATELYCLASTAVKRINILDEPFKLLMLGGVLQNNEYVNSEVIRQIKDDMVNVDIITNYGTPIDLIVQRGLNG